ncbi:MAG: flagellar basal body P-ring protein FlgI [Planctomycetes bacterium]|nr:flagellar basal body P-ring protein FlgI [Planctomycetota bacterium]
MTRLRPLGWFLLFGLSVALPSAWLSAAKSKSVEDGDDKDKRYATKVETPMIGDYTTFSGLQPVLVEGVGLVVGLNGTGGDPSPSPYRTILLNELKRRKVPNPNSILASPNTALVIVRAYLKPLLKKGELLDVEIEIPESAEATSLTGGWLMELYLSEQAFVPGHAAPLTGHAYARAEGAVLTVGVGSDAATSPELLKKGRVLGGATVMKERELALYLRHDFRSVRNSARLAEVIGRRFHDFDEHGIKKPMAKAKTDQKIVLSVHPRYKNDYPRYLQVIRHLAFREDSVGARIRMQKLEEDIFTADRAEECALELEAIGNDAIPILKQALTSPLLEVRVHAAIALAYLGESDGLPALKEAAAKERAFRVYALTAMSAIEDADSHLALRELMSEAGAETRYGAFRSLWTLDKRDPFIRGELLGVRLDEEGKPSRRTGEYMLHTLQTSGEPMVHALTRTRPEIVLFGADQEFRSPMYLSAGRHIMVTSQPGATTVTLSKFQVGQPDQRREVSMQIADVIRAADDLGATYPDIVQLLADASKQKNLPNRLAVNELPEGGRVYYRPTSPDAPGKKRKTRIGRDNMTPNLFPEQDAPDPTDDRKKAEARANMASVSEESKARKTDGDKKSSDKEKSIKEDSRDDKPRGMFSWLGSWRKVDK